MNLIEITQGDSPLGMGLPHTGTFVPDGCLARLNPQGRALTDTDWHIENLYAGLVPGATSVRSLVHRYVIDANRGPSDESLYPGRNTTCLCPVTDFDGHPIYGPGQEPDTAEIERRRAMYHAPYHTALQTGLERVRAKHGFAILYDCHSIRSHVPFLFDGILPNFNIGTNNGTTCAPGIETAVDDLCHSSMGYTSVLNGRLKGGWTTRHYGRPSEGLHAIQMELAQATHIVERAPWDMVPDRANRLRAHLKTILETLTAWRPE